MNAKRHDRLSLVLPTILVVALTLAPSLAADPSEDWPRWNGPRLDLTAPGSEVFSGSEIGLESAWTKDLGSGYSGIVVVGDALVTAFSDGESDFFVALDAASGEERWRYRIAKTYKGHDGSDDGPLSSPLIADGRVYGLGPWGHLFAVRLDNGQELWAQKVDEGGGARKPEYGFTTAPTLVDGVLIVQTGGPEGHSISGFDPANGKRLWATADDSVSYQSPLPMRIDGTTQVLAVTDAHLIGLDPKNGEILWQEVHPEGVSYGSAQPVPLGDGKVLLPDWRGAALVQVSRADGGGYAVEELWKSRGFRGTYTVPVPHEGHIYGYSGNFLSAVDAATGEVVWKSRPPGRGNLVLVDGHLVIQASSGEIVIAEATPEGYKEKARL